LENRRSKAVEIIVLIILVSSFIIINSSLVLAQNSAGDLALSVTTDKSEYVTGDNVYVSGYVYNTTTLKPADVIVRIEILKGSDTKFNTDEATFNGTYGNGDYRVSDSGKLTITAKATANGVTTTASTTVNIKTVSQYFSFLGVVAAPIVVIACLVYFLMLFIPQRKILSGRSFVATEFAFLTIFTFGVSLFFIFNEVPVGINAPMGLVTNTIGNETQWVLNIGGQLSTNSAQYLGGIQVPIYIIALAFLGAYAYFIINVPSLLKQKDMEELECKGLNHLVRFFVAPLLAAALYLVLWQLDVKGTFILAATSFATGMIIEQVVDRILSFAKNTIGTGQNKPQEDTPQEK